MNYFAVSDIHGCLRKFNHLLENFNPEKEQLVLVGDYIDRGPDSLGVLKRIMELKELYPSTIVLRGNHEDLFLKLINNKMDSAKARDYLHYDGGKDTIESLMDYMLDTSDLKKLEERLTLILPEIVQDYKEILDFLTNDLLSYYETENILFTHAGYNTSANEWTKTTEEQFIWYRRHYEKVPNTHHINVFGHTRVKDIRVKTGNGESDNPLLIKYAKGSYLAIDGGCAYGGQLNAVVLNEKGVILNTYDSW